MSLKRVEMLLVLGLAVGFYGLGWELPAILVGGLAGAVLWDYLTGRDAWQAEQTKRRRESEESFRRYDQWVSACEAEANSAPEELPF